jgi:hypothetical protein
MAIAKGGGGKTLGRRFDPNRDYRCKQPLMVRVRLWGDDRAIPGTPTPEPPVMTLTLPYIHLLLSDVDLDGCTQTKEFPDLSKALDGSQESAIHLIETILFRTA